MRFYKVKKDVYVVLDRINYVRVANFRCHEDAVHRYEVRIHYIDDVLTVYLTREEWIAFQKEMDQYS